MKFILLALLVLNLIVLIEKYKKKLKEKIKKKSESQKEIRLRSRTVFPDEPELEDMVNEPIKVFKPPKTTRKRNQKLPSVIDQLEPPKTS